VENCFTYNKAFKLEHGGELPCFNLTYHTFGTFDPNLNNVVWICHALTANSNPMEWWPGLVGDDYFFNPKEHFIICVNMPGSCYGSVGPLSINPQTNAPYYLTFPEITIRDMVNMYNLLRQHLGIEKIQYLVGGSMGGQQAMEFAYLLGSAVSRLVLLATNALHSPWGVAFSESQRMAIRADNTWGEPNENAAKKGLEAARAIALLSYRSYEAYHATQADNEKENVGLQKAVTYQNYQGQKLVKRFNAYAYWYLTKAMDSHNIGRGRGGAIYALKQLTAQTIVIGIHSDYLFPLSEQKFIAEHVQNGTFVNIPSLYGHDGFLIEAEKITAVLKTAF
jgi:homoserine O-acetyltransferase